MKIFIASNFVVPGLDNAENLDLNGSEITLRDFLEELSKLSANQLQYIEPGADRLEPED